MEAHPQECAVDFDEDGLFILMAHLHMVNPNLLNLKGLFSPHSSINRWMALRSAFPKVSKLRPHQVANDRSGR